MDISQQLDRLLGASPVLVGEVKGLQLDGQESKAVTFTEQKPPQPPPAEQGGAAGAAAAPAAPPADAAEAVDVTRGLIAVVTEGDRKTHFFIEVEPRPPGSFLVADAEIVPSGGAEVLRIGVRPRPGEQIPGLADAPLIVKFSEENPVLDRRLQIRDRGEIPSNTAEAQLEFALRRDETQWRVLLDVGSMLGESEVFYNRALDLQITDQRGEVRVEDRRGDYNMVQIDELWMGADEKTRIRFRGQAELPNAQFSVRTLRGAPAPVITIGFHVDARNSAFTRFGDQVKLWAGGQLLDLDQKHADRQVAARVVELGVDGLVLQTRVEDFWYEWRPQQSEAVVPLRLELVLAEGGKTEYTTSVKLDAELPKIVELTEGTLPVSRSGAPQLVVKAFDTLTGISRVQVARNFDPDQAFGDNDTVLEAVNIQLGYIEAEQVYRWQGDLPADLAKPGETVRLAVRAFDGVGHASEPRITEVTLPRQLGPPPPPKGTIVGTASFSGRPEEPITVTLAGPDGLMRSAVIDDQKKFLFSELPAGDYTLSAEGSVRLQVAGVKKVSGTEPVSGFDPAKTKTRAVTLTLRTSE